MLAGIYNNPVGVLDHRRPWGRERGRMLLFTPNVYIDLSYQRNMLHKIFNKHCILGTSVFIYSGNGIISELDIS
jgi:hypothetical protein